MAHYRSKRKGRQVSHVLLFKENPFQMGRQHYDPEEVSKAVDELTGKEDYNNLLIEIVKPYGKVYAVNKRRIPEMMFTYQPWGFHEMTGM